MVNMINIQDNDYVTFANRLEKIGRADLPVAIRGTLNQMAFEMKGTGSKRGQIDIRAEKDFDYRRNKTLFKVMTGVDKAKGLNIKSMESESGIISRSGRNELAEGLADQQKGGKTKQKATPLSPSRISKEESKRIGANRKLKKIPNAIKVRRARGDKYIRKAILAEKYDRPIMITGKRGDNYIARVSVKKNRDDLDINLTFLYRINRTKTVDLKKKRPFVNRAAQEVMKGMPQEFIRQANKRIQKSLRK